MKNGKTRLTVSLVNKHQLYSFRTTVGSFVITLNGSSMKLLNSVQTIWKR